MRNRSLPEKDGSYIFFHETLQISDRQWFRKQIPLIISRIILFDKFKYILSSFFICPIPCYVYFYSTNFVLYYTTYFVKLNRIRLFSLSSHTGLLHYMEECFHPGGISDDGTDRLPVGFLPEIWKKVLPFL